MNRPTIVKVDVARVSEALDGYLTRSPYSSRTQQSYAYSWTRWEEFCSAEGIDPFAATVADIRGLLKALFRGELRRPRPGGACLDGPWAPSTVEAILAAISDKYLAMGRLAPCDPRAADYPIVRELMNGYARDCARGGRSRASAPGLELDALPTVAEVALSEAGKGLLVRMAVLSDLGGLHLHELSEASSEDLRATGPESSTLQLPARRLALNCDHSSPLRHLLCLRCVLHEAADRDGCDLLLANPGEEPAVTLKRVTGQLNRRYWLWGVAQALPANPGDSGRAEFGTGRAELTLGLVLSTMPGLLKQVRALAAFQLSRWTGMTVVAVTREITRGALRMDEAVWTLVVHDEPGPTRRYALGFESTRDDLEAFWSWVTITDAVAADPARPLFCALHPSRLGLDPQKRLSIQTASTLHWASGLAQLAELTSRSGRHGFAAQLGAAGVGLMDATLALGLRKPETLQAYYPAASGERAARTLQTFDDRLAQGPHHD